MQQRYICSRRIIHGLKNALDSKKISNSLKQVKADVQNVDGRLKSLSPEVRRADKEALSISNTDADNAFGESNFSD